MRLSLLTMLASTASIFAGVGSIGGSPYAPFDLDTRAYMSNIVANSGTVTFSQAYAVDHFVKSAKSHGYWSNLLEVGPFAGDQLAAALVKLKAYTGLPMTLTNHSFVSGDYTSLVGITGSSSKWLDTGFNASTFGSKNVGIGFFINDEWVDTSGSFMTPIGTSGALGSPIVGVFINGGRPMGLVSYNGGGSSGKDLVVASGASCYSIGKGFAYSIRRSNTEFKTFFNGILGTTYTTAETNAPLNTTFSVFAGRSATAQNFYTHPGSFYSIDDGTMDDAHCALFAADVLQLQRDLLRLTPVVSTLEGTIVIGQSLATGSQGTPVVSTNQPYKNRSATLTSSGNAIFPVLNFPPLVESNQQTIQSSCSELVSATWRLTHPGSITHDLFTSDFGIGGAAYSVLKKGGSGTAYANSITVLSNAVRAVPDYATQLLIPGVLCVHGETDWNSTNYSANIAQWQSDYQSDIQTLTGQSASIPMFHTQISAWTSTANGNSATAVSPYQVLSRFELEPTKTILVGPKYIFSYASDGVHLTNGLMYQWLGEYYAKAWYEVVVLGHSWSPLYPTNISRTTSNIDLTFSGAVGNLVLDTTLVSNPGNYGFEYTDDSSPPAISSVSITGSNTVRVTLASTPTGSNKKIRYAYTGIAGNSGGPTTGPRGNLRDSDTTYTSLHSNTLYNWCVHFDKACP